MTKFLKPAEAAPLILNARTGQPGISRARVALLCKQGRLGQRVGSGWIISTDEIEQFNQQIRVAHRPTKPR